MSALRDVVGQSSWLFLSRVLGAVLQAVVLAALARQLVPADLGVVVVTIGLLTFASGLGGLGLGPYALRSYARDRLLQKKIMVINAWSTFTVSCMAIAVVGIVSKVFSHSLSQLVALLPLALWVGAEKNTDLWTNIAVAGGRSKLASLTLLLNRISLLAGFFTVLSLTKEPILAYTTGLAIGAVLGNLILRTLVKTSAVLSPNAEGARQVLKQAFPFFLNTLGSQIRNLDTTIVAALASPMVSGLYGLPARLISPLRLVPNAIAPIVMRYTAEGSRSGLRAVRVLILGTLCFSTTGMAVVATLAPKLVVRAFGPDYSGSIVPLQVLSGGLIFAFAVTLLTSVLQGRGRERIVGYTSVVSNVVAIFAIAAGALTWGATGAALGLSLSYAAHALFLLSILLRR